MQFPEYFAEMLEENRLPIPPIPLSAIPFLEEREPAFFATDARPFTRNLHCINLDSLDMMRRGGGFPFALNAPQDMASHEDGVLYVGCGLRGYGLQNRYFCYALEMASLRIVLSFPWGNVYEDADGAYESLEGLLHVIELCQHMQGTMKEGCVLELALGQECVWQVLETTEDMTDSGASPEDLANPDDSGVYCLAKGDSIASLLDYMVTVDKGKTIDSSTWLRI